MNKSIRLHRAISDQSSQRLNAFPGRNLGEQAFKLMQDYVDERVDPLLGSGHPGIIEGLHLTTHHPGRQVQFHVQPGTAVGLDGRAVRVFYPIELDWDALLAAHRHANADAEAVLHGFYFLTVRRLVDRVEDNPKARPCTRDQLDPLRDSRIETYATLDLQYITSLSSLMDMSQRRAVNRLCVRFLNEAVFRRDTGAVPLAIVRIDKNTPQWIDTIGGRFMAQADAPYHTFAAHWDSVIQAFDGAEPAALHQKALAKLGGLRSARKPAGVAGSTFLADLGHRPRSPFDSPFADLRLIDELAVTEAEIKTIKEIPRTLRELLGVDYMPAAGRFPESLVTDIAGRHAGEEGNEWTLPALQFEPRDLQVELLPVPASTATGVIRRELPRGALNLVHYQGDRLRIMVAVEDRDYRADLLDLPEVDHDLLDDLYERASLAIETEHQWATAHRELYHNLDLGLLEEPELTAEQLAKLEEAGVEIDPDTGEFDLSNALREKLGLPEAKVTDEGLALLKNTYLVAGYSTAEDIDYPRLNEEHREQLGIPPAISNALRPDAFFSQLKKQGTGRPYSNITPQAPDGYSLPGFAPSGDDGLYRQSASLAEEIAQLEEALEENHDLIDELNDFLSVQRQHLDSITTNFAALAGGVAGDGSGLRLMRWANALTFQKPKDS